MAMFFCNATVNECLLQIAQITFVGGKRGAGSESTKNPIFEIICAAQNAQLEGFAGPSGRSY